MLVPRWISRLLLSIRYVHRALTTSVRFESKRNSSSSFRSIADLANMQQDLSQRWAMLHWRATRWSSAMLMPRWILWSTMRAQYCPSLLVWWRFTVDWYLVNRPKSCAPKNPCMNAAKCITTSAGSQCACIKGTSGVLCERSKWFLPE